jgi:hypothetical protein
MKGTGRQFFVMPTPHYFSGNVVYYQVFLGGFEGLPLISDVFPERVQASGNLRRVIGTENDQIVLWEDIGKRFPEFEVEGVIPGARITTSGQAISRDGKIAIIEVSKGGPGEVHLWEINNNVTIPLHPPVDRPSENVKVTHLKHLWKHRSGHVLWNKIQYQL